MTSVHDDCFPVGAASTSESTLTCLFRDFRTRCGPTGVSRHELWSINMELKYLLLKTKLSYLTSAHFCCFKRLYSLFLEVIYTCSANFKFGAYPHTLSIKMFYP